MQTPAQIVTAKLIELARSAETQAAKAEVFAQFAGHLAAATSGAWSATRMISNDGSVIFLGRFGEIAVFTPDGNVLKGKPGSYFAKAPGIELDYEKLIKL